MLGLKPRYDVAGGYHGDDDGDDQDGSDYDDDDGDEDDDDT